MEELSIEEKVKRYDKAIEIAKSKIKNDKDHVLYEDDVIEIFPELKESEDEKTRKEITEFFKNYSEHGTWKAISDVTRWIAWLEKQGEHKPAWSEEDETALCDALWCCKQAASIAKDENDMGNVWYAERWLKSLSPKSHWKPSEEQLRELHCVISGCSFETPILVELEEQLKKL